MKIHEDRSHMNIAGMYFSCGSFLLGFGLNKE